MRRDEAQALTALTRARFEAERARLRDFLATEAALRRDLARLDAHAREAAQAGPETLSAVRAVGGDIAWRGWQMHKRAEVNRRLALHLAQKERVLSRLRQSFGKAEAARELSAAAADAARREGHRRAWVAVFDQAIMSAGQGGWRA